MKIYLVRHGETDWNLQKRWQGTTDIELNETGIAQAEKLAKRFDEYNIDAIYCSPLGRAKKTAEVVQQNKNLPLFVKEDLKEVILGEWEGSTFEEVVSKYKKEFELWEGNHKEQIGFGVENYYDLQQRAFNVLQEICDEAKGDVLVVTHGAWIRALVCKIMCIPLEHRLYFDVDNTSITTVEYKKSKFSIKTLNDAIHIEM